MKELDFIANTERKDTKASVAKRHDEAMTRRRREFWHPILKTFYYGYENAPDTPIDVERYKNVRLHVLNYLEECTAEFAKGVCRLPLAYRSQRQLMAVVMFIAAFDTGFKFTPADPDDAKDPVDSDTLSGEAAFQQEILEALDRYILEAAKLARRVGSVNYSQWTRALIMLAEVRGKHFEKSALAARIREIMQLIVASQQQLWADVRVNG